MVFKRFYNDKLAHASYLIGCSATGEAAVIDAGRDVEQYIEAAAEERLRITAVTETHIHADYLSGSKELAHLTGAQLYLSDEGDEDWKYAFAEETGAKLIRHGDQIRIGNVRLDVIKTAGHTPEHISFILIDEPASTEPLGVFTGDFVFVGDVGRPDLLETAAGFSGTMEPGARTLYKSLTEFKKLPPHVLIWPAHGAGSACGKSLGGVPVSSLGYELAANWALKDSTEESFVREVLAGQPEPPKYFAQMKRLNKLGPPMRSGLKAPPRLSDPDALQKALAARAYVVDVRPSALYAEQHLQGSLHIPLGKSFITWAGWLIPYDQDITLIASSAAEVEEAVHDLALIGLDRVVGWYGREFVRGGKTLRQIQMSEACEKEELALLDVRGSSEWMSGHAPGAIHVPLGYLQARSAELPRDRMVAVYCQGGGRSPIAASVLERAGWEDVIDIVDGYSGYCAAKASV